MSQKSVTYEKDVNKSKLKKLLDLLRSKPHVKVGILHDAGLHKDENGNSTGLTVANIAVFNEFGTDRAPARPFMRYSAKKLTPEIKVLSRKLLDGLVQGKLTIDMSLTIIGEKAKAEIKSVIVGWDTPPNAESTILQKARKAGRQKLSKASKEGNGAYESLLSQYNNPLIDTSQMLNSVNYQKVKK